MRDYSSDNEDSDSVPPLGLRDYSSDDVDSDEDSIPPIVANDDDSINESIDVVTIENNYSSIKIQNRGMPHEHVIVPISDLE